MGAWDDEKRTGLIFFLFSFCWSEVAGGGMVGGGGWRWAVVLLWMGKPLEIKNK